MAPVRNGRHLLNEVPENQLIPGRTTIYDTSQTIDVETVALNGGFLIKTLFVAIDPYLRAMMIPSLRNQDRVKHFKVGQPLVNYGVGLVLRSEFPEAKAGDHVYGLIPFQEYSVLPDFENSIERMHVLDNRAALPWPVYLGAGGMPGQTSYMAWKEFAKAKRGDVAFITAGSGVVGSLVIQLAKRDGVKVISCAGSDEKIQYIKDLGADVTFNYKTTNVQDVLEKEGPIDIFWDNVGGETLDAALYHANVGARFLMSGWMSGYNGGHAPIQNLHTIISKEITMNGFLVWSIIPKYQDQFYKEFIPLLADGTFTHREEITTGLDKAGEVLAGVLQGKNFGKAIIHVADE